MPRSRTKSPKVKTTGGSGSRVVLRKSLLGRKVANETIDLTEDSFTELPEKTMKKSPDIKVIEIINLDETKEEGEITRVETDDEDEVKLIGVILTGDPALKDSKKAESTAIKPMELRVTKPTYFAMPKTSASDTVKKSPKNTFSFPSFEILKQQVDIMEKQKSTNSFSNANTYQKKDKLRCLVNDNTKGIIKKKKHGRVGTSHLSQRVQPRGRNQGNKRFGANPFYQNVSEFRRFGPQNNLENVAFNPIQSTYRFNNTHNRFAKPQPAKAPVYTSDGSYFVSSDAREEDRSPGKYRPIYIDGSNVAIGHGNSNCFSSLGVKICVDYFKSLGVTTVKAFVPQFRRKAKESKDRHILEELEKQGNIIFTPSREVAGRSIVPYDDRYIIQAAVLSGGIIVSNDNYRDLYDEQVSFRETITNRILPFTWISDQIIMFPADPMGRNGPSLDKFLRF